MQPHKIIVRIKNGQTQFEVNGIKGPACSDIAKRFAEALGTAKSIQNTGEFYEVAEATETQAQS
jgi:hypothetical protein